MSSTTLTNSVDLGFTNRIADKSVGLFVHGAALTRV